MTVVVDSSVLAESLVDARSEGEWAEAALAADARAVPMSDPRAEAACKRAAATSR